MLAHPQPVILCASARLARGLRTWSQQQNQAQGLQQWNAATILPLSDWLNETIEHAMLMGKINVEEAPLGMLNTTQEGLLWEQSIQSALKAHDAAALFNTSGLASAAMEANRYMIEWNISIDPTQATEETKQFFKWRQLFQAKCKQSGYLEQVRYLSWQLNQLEQASLSLPSHIQLAGFDRINPHLQRLTSILQDKGVSVTQFTLDARTESEDAHISHLICTEQMDECRVAVAWAKAHLTQKPGARLAIVVPELEKLRPTLMHLLDDKFHPLSLNPALAEQTRIYEFSLGLPLTQWPLIQTALVLLRMAFYGGTQAQTAYAQLLGDIYWSHSLSEADARARLDAQMRSTMPLNLNAQSFLQFVTRVQTDQHSIACPRLLSDLQALLDLAKQAPKRQAPSMWAERFKQCLEATHWQGERGLSSVEYQTVQSFERVRKEMATLDTWLGSISALEALQRLTQLCQAQIFQPETTVQPNITLMGMLEAAAQPLDAMWVMGMNDHVWPPLARTNALIPAELQRHAGTPNASSEVQASFAHNIHQRLLRSANTIVFSSAEKEGDRLLRVSPLLQDVPLHTHSVNSAHTLAEQLAQAGKRDWQWLDDQQAPAVFEGEHVAGGTGLLRAQAICPAWAFYQYRLKTRALDEATQGLDAMERGTLIHAVLAKFWLANANKSLSEIDRQALASQCTQMAHAVMQDFNAEHHEYFSPIFLQLEAERLSRLALTWLLEIDFNRPAPFKVEACEQEFKPLIEGIQIKLIIDRIDRLEDGRLVVIDYKTSSKLNYKNWAQDCITEPQLPIYAAFVLQDAEVAAVCFGRVRTADNGFVGIAAADGLVQGAEVYDREKRRTFDEPQFSEWHDILSHWRNRITATALALKQGDARIVFENETDLAYCDVLPLLRLPERQLQFERMQQQTARQP